MDGGGRDTDLSKIIINCLQKLYKSSLTIDFIGTIDFVGITVQIHLKKMVNWTLVVIGSNHICIIIIINQIMSAQSSWIFF